MVKTFPIANHDDQTKTNYFAIIDLKITVKTELNPFERNSCHCHAVILNLNEIRGEKLMAEF